MPAKRDLVYEVQFDGNDGPRDHTFSRRTYSSATSAATGAWHFLVSKPTNEAVDEDGDVQ